MPAIIYLPFVILWIYYCCCKIVCTAKTLNKALLDKRVIPSNIPQPCNDIQENYTILSLKVKRHKEEFTSLGTLHYVSYLKTTSKPENNC